ncbi:hypothetical protein ACOSQ3_006426 [Xanthoceras sorbifolium]
MVDGVKLNIHVDEFGSQKRVLVVVKAIADEVGMDEAGVGERVVAGAEEEEEEEKLTGELVRVGFGEEL